MDSMSAQQPEGKVIGPVVSHVLCITFTVLLYVQILEMIMFIGVG